MKGKNKNLILMGLIIAFALALRLVFFTGIDSSDSLGYTKAAYNLMNHTPLKDSLGVGTLRLGIIFPVSILYSAFGVNEFSSNIIVLLASLSSIVLLYKFGKLLFSEKAGILGAFLLSFFPFDVINSTRLNTDITSAFFVALSVYFFLKYEKNYNKTDSKMLCLFSGLSLGVAYLIKELSLLIVLFFAVYFIYNKKININHFFIALGFIMIFSLELFYFYNLTGNMFYRSSYINSNYATGIIIENSMQGRSNLLTGFFHYPYLMVNNSLLGIFYPFIFIAIFYSIVDKKKQARIPLFWFLPIILYLNFGSLSATRYIPIPATVRFLSMITVPGILLLSFFLSQNTPLTKNILKPAVIILLLVTSIGFIYLSKDRFSLYNERDAYDYLKSHPKKNTYTDERTLAMFDYISGYKKTDNFKSFHHYEPLKSENTYALNMSGLKDSYIIINYRIIDFLAVSKKGIKIPEDVLHVPKTWILEKEIGSEGNNKIEIYYAP